MDNTTFTIGADVSCTDGDCGAVSRVVVDPVARTVTHLVIDPKGRLGPARLVPLDLVDVADDQIRLRCTLEEFEKLDPAEETQFVPGTTPYADYHPGQVMAWPYLSLGAGGLPGEAFPGVAETVTYDTLPLGEVAVRRGERVHATDAEIGHVEGLVIDPRSHHVTHVLLKEGHLWDRKEVAIPIRAVADVQDGIRLNLTKAEVQDLPPVDVAHPDW
jgi:sporulation protein YlmC with PRC-barrel domain